MKNLQAALRIQNNKIVKLNIEKANAMEEYENIIFFAGIERLKELQKIIDLCVSELVVVRERIKRIEKNIELKQKETDKEIAEQKRIANREARAISKSQLEWKKLNADDFELIYEQENNSATTVKYEIFKNSFKLKDQELFDMLGGNFGGNHIIYANAEYVHLYVD